MPRPTRNLHEAFASLTAEDIARVFEEVRREPFDPDEEEPMAIPPEFARRVVAGDPK